MEAAGLALAIVGTVELCLKYGKSVIDACASFRSAESELAERALSVEALWKRTAIQLDFLRKVWDDLDSEHQSIQFRILKVLENKLELTLSKLNGLLNKKPDTVGSDDVHVAKIKRIKYVATKQYLDEAIADLDAWQKKFDPSWFLILRVPGRSIDREMRKERLAISASANCSSLRDALRPEPDEEVAVFLPNHGLEGVQIQEIRYSPSWCIQRPQSGKWLVLNRVMYIPAIERIVAERNVRSLARRLISVEPFTFGILQCRGVVRVMHPSGGDLSAFDFAFKVPEGLNSAPRSLRHYLQSETHLSLTARFDLAKTIAKAVGYVHVIDFVHKNIRPENILGFTVGDSQNPAFFLTGFENPRSVDGQTVFAGELSWEKNLYRHPRRHGLNPGVRYNMQHDIYSLGVCLLEIGLWKTLVLYKEETPDPVPAPALDITSDDALLNQPDQLKQHLTDIATQRLPQTMGERYTKVVVDCLTCLDPDNVDFGDSEEFEDADCISVGVRYIEKILLKLEEIVV